MAVCFWYVDGAVFLFFTKSNIYRIFCCFDEGNIIVLFNGFQKKSRKTPKKEITKALKIKDEYFKLKREGLL